MDLVGDGVQQVGLAQAGLAVDEQGVVGLGGPLGHRLGRRVGEFVGRAHHEPLKGVLLGARQKDIVGFFLAEVLQLALSRTTTSKSAEKSSWSAFWITGR